MSLSHIEVEDGLPLPGLTSSGATAISFSRALLLLAIATSPAPGSRYQPASNWALLRYSTVRDPRLVLRTSSFIVNSGIEDLDPHQKSALSDDMGVALALELLDSTFGILGLADVYQLVAQDLVRLRHYGRHRSMPDFLLFLEKPIAGRRIAFLECKGSTLERSSTTQLATACVKQLGNIDTLVGSPARAVPRVASAARLVPGQQARVILSDPPEDDIDENAIVPILRANWLALEYQFFGAVDLANHVWETFDLPTWTVMRTPQRGFAWEATTEVAIQQGRAPMLPGINSLERYKALRPCHVAVDVTAKASALASRMAEGGDFYATVMGRDSQRGPAAISVDGNLSDDDYAIREAGSTAAGSWVQHRWRISF
jgi:hypothetical protein